MSLTVSAPKTANIKRMEDGTYLAVCCGMVDLGAVYNKRYYKYQDKVLLLWEVPGETIEIDGKEEPRILSARYTATLGTQGNLRRDLVSWRGKEFTEDELDEFIETFELYGGEYGFHTINKIVEIEFKDRLI